MRPDRNLWIALLIFATCFAVYRVAPRGQLYDSRFTLAVASQIAHHGTPDLSPLSGSLLDEDLSPEAAAARDYRLVLSGGRLHFLYPPGTPLLAAPFVWILDRLDRPVVDHAGRFHRGVERRQQRILAALAMAAFCVVLYRTALVLLDERTSLALVLTFALGSSIFSTASRSLWSHTACVLLQSGVVLLLIRRCAAERPVPAVAIATLLAFGVLCRPTAAIPALAVTVFVAASDRSRLPALLATGIVWAAVFAAGSQLAHGTWLPPYYQPGLHTFEPMPEALAGNLVSPARGLLVYSPWIVAVCVLLLRRRQSLPHKTLALLGVSIVILHWLFVSFHAPWWGGWGYGPRLMTDVLPWIALLAVLALAAGPAPGRSGLAVAGVLVAVSIVLHGVGAFSRGAVTWNEGQLESDFGARLWDPRDPPFLR